MDFPCVQLIGVEKMVESSVAKPHHWGPLGRLPLWCSACQHQVLRHHCWEVNIKEVPVNGQSEEHIWQKSYASQHDISHGNSNSKQLMLGLAFIVRSLFPATKCDGGT